MRRLVLLGTLAVLTLLAGRALAMSQASYRMAWFVPLTGGGGGPAASSGYRVNLTVGQAVIGASASSGSKVCLGYWCGITEAAALAHRVWLPLLVRGY